MTTTGETTTGEIRDQRFPLVMLLSLIAVLWTVAAPRSDLTRAVALLVQGGALLVAVVSARGHRRLRQRSASLLALALLGACGLTGFGLLSDTVRVWAALGIALATPAVMVRGLVRLLREHGVVAQAVFGALALYLQIGLIFAFVGAGLGHVQATPFFAGQTQEPLNDFVYWSFTTMSTTGYGDLTPATNAGRSLAVLSMLVGQIYLVTVVALLVGNMRPRDRASI